MLAVLHTYKIPPGDPGRQVGRYITTFVQSVAGPWRRRWIKLYPGPATIVSRLVVSAPCAKQQPHALPGFPRSRTCGFLGGFPGERGPGGEDVKPRARSRFNPLVPYFETPKHRWATARLGRLLTAKGSASLADTCGLGRLGLSSYYIVCRARSGCGSRHSTLTRGALKVPGREGAGVDRTLTPRPGLLLILGHTANPGRMANNK